MWTSEKEYLAELLKVEKPGKHASYIQHASSISQGAGSQSKDLLILRKKKKREQRTPEPYATIGEGNNTQQQSETADEESSEVEEEETEIALDWLRATWKPVVQYLRQKEPNGEWVTDY